MKNMVWVCLVICLLSLRTSGQPFDWAVGAGGSSGDYGNAIATDSLGYSYVTGWFQNTAAFGPYNLTSAGGYDIFIVKYDPSGQVVWALREGGTQTDIGYGIAVDENGNLYLAGTFKGTVMFGGTNTLVSSNASSDILVARYDTSGTLIWAHSGGSSTDDQAQGICLHPFGGVYVTGYFKQTASFNGKIVTSAGQSDMFLARYDSAYSGTAPAWVQGGGGTATDNAYGVASDASGYAYVTGYYSGQAAFGGQVLQSAGDDDVYIVKYDAAGNDIWVYGGGGQGTDRGLQVAAHGNRVFFSGWFNGTAFLSAQPLVSAGLDDIFIAAIDTAAPNVVWSQRAGGAGYDQGYGICTNATGDVLVTGAFDSIAQFGGMTLISQGSWDVFVARYSKTGVLDWVVTGGSPATNTFQRDIGYAVSTDDMQNVYVTGIIRNTAAFGPWNVTSAGAQDAFVARLSHLTTTGHVWMPGRLELFPNPATDEVYITGEIERPGHIRIYDSAGLLVRTVHVAIESKMVPLKVSVRGLSPGLYWLNADGAGVGKVLKVPE